MKIFLDTSDTEVIKKLLQGGDLMDGVTTNPSLILKSGREPWDVYGELVSMGIPDISMEVMGKDAEEMYEEGVKSTMSLDHRPLLRSLVL